MNKNAIKKFAIEARKKLIDSVTDKAGMLGIIEKSCSEPITKGADFEVYQTVAGTEVTLNKRQCEQRRRLVSQIESRGFEAVVEEVAYTWFNRICAIRFMEVNDYLPNRVRVLSSEKEGKMEPDLVTQAPDVDLDLTAQEKEEIINWKMSGTSENTDKLYCKLFLKQCHQMHDILPGLFKADSDYMELLFGISYTNKDDVIYMLVNPETGIPEADFNVSTLDEEGNPTGQVEIIGWLYQYYNTELKDDTFAKLKKNVKITKERIPAATQLFTPDWIVRYMAENSVGRIWIEHLRAVDPSTDEKATAERFGWKYYLPEAEQEEAVNVKLAEIRTTYKDLKPTDITCIDPCMGSGHILIAMFDVLIDIYKSAGYSERDAAFLIVENNIHGLDIDKRAYQLAYFAVMMKGRGYNRRFFSGKQNEDGERVAVKPQVYVIEESNGVNRTQLKYFGADLSETEKNEALKQMNELLDELRDATEYGSILNISNYNWDLLRRFADKESSDGQLSFDTLGIDETQNKLKKLINIGRLLSMPFYAVNTNPPYLGVSVCNQKVNNYVKENYFKTKTDLFAVFMIKCSTMLARHGLFAMINQHSWMFLKSFTELRKNIACLDTINMAHLGARAFEEIAGEVVQTTSFVKRKSNIINYCGTYVRLVDFPNQNSKEKEFLNGGNRYYIATSEFDNIENSPVAYWVPKRLFEIFRKEKQIGDYGDARVGMQTGENDKFIRLWHEIDYTKLCINAPNSELAQKSKAKWFPYNKGGEARKWYGNNDWVVDWYNDGQNIKKDKLYKLSIGQCLPSNSKPKNMQYYFRESITWSKVASGMIAFRYKKPGHIFDIAGASIFTSNELIKYMQGYCNSVVATFIAYVLSPTINYEAGTVSKFPLVVDYNYKSEVDRLVSENIEISEADDNSYETSWGFMRHPLANGFLIQNEYEKWELQTKSRFEKMQINEESLNSIFIKIYGLENEMEASVEDKNISVHKADRTKDIKGLISYAVGCMFGRYSLDVDGLAYAGGDWDNTKYTSFIPDADNIIPITDEEYFSDDIVGRFCEWLKVVYGEDSLEENLDFIAQALGNKGDTSREVIRNYFLTDFIKDHMKIYQKRPIYWLFDSGKANGFKALIYMHRYNPDTVGTVRTEYLHKTQKAIEQAMERATYISSNGSGSEKAKATKQIVKYTKQLAEIHTYDEAMAHIANQRIDIDLDDGVKVNYEKFQGVEVAQEGKKTIKVDLLAKMK